MVTRLALAGAVALLVLPSGAAAEIAELRCDAPPPPLAPERLRTLRGVSVEDPGPAIRTVGSELGFGVPAAAVSVDARALAATLREDLARLLAAAPADVAGPDGLRLVVGVADVATVARSGALRGTVASRVVLTASLRAEGGAGEERWSGAFEGRAERRVFSWRTSHHVETLSEAYCAALRRLASGLPALEPGASLEAVPRPSTSTEPLVVGRPVEGRVETSAGAFVPRATSSATFALATRVGWSALPGVELGGAFEWHTASVGTLAFSGSGRTVADADVDEFPLLAYVRLGRPGKPRIVPYAGLAGGWDVCFVSPAGRETELLGQWMWQAWAGIATRIWYRGAPTAATVGIEAFYDGARPEGSVQDAAGERHHEILDLSGGGVRAVLAAEY